MLIAQTKLPQKKPAGRNYERWVNSGNFQPIQFTFGVESFKLELFCEYYSVLLIMVTFHQSDLLVTAIFWS